MLSRTPNAYIANALIVNMATTSTEASKLKPGSYVNIDGEPCKVTSMTKSKPGKHGSAKARVEAVGVFDGKKRNILQPASSSVEVPVIEKKRAQVISVSGDIVQLMDLTDYSTFETTIPEEFSGQLEAGHEVLFWKYESNIMIKEHFKS
jgi:translation initiation factor 5A